MKILLLEDDDGGGESLFRGLELRGHDVAWFRTLAEFKRVYEFDKFDLIIVDFQLPDGTGIDAISSIRGSDKARTVLYSGLDRTKELDAANIEVDRQINKGDPFELMDYVEYLEST